MWIVKLALDRPYTFLVAALLILLLGSFSIVKTPVDIFPNIDIPVVSIIWNYTGFSPQEMERRIITPTERGLTTTVNDIEHVESQSLNGVAVEKIYFHPGVKIDMAVAQVTAIAQTMLRSLPPGTTPPLVLQYSASSVPIIQLSTSSNTLSEQQLNDQSMNFIRPKLTNIEGAAIPYPYGGKMRQVQVDINIPALQAHHLTPNDVVNALSVQNLILPSGTAKIGPMEYDVSLDGSPETIDELNNLPIKSENGAIIYIRDVALIRDGSSPQTNIVRQDGIRSTLLSILKNGNVSTLKIVDDVKGLLPLIKRQLAPGFESLDVHAIFDQSLFVKASISGVLKEMVTAACLTGLMILLFLGDWRSTLIIAVSIPLSILSALIILGSLGETINIMTLGGLALAVGILVDDATVTIENIETHLARRKPLLVAIYDGAGEIATPAFVSTLCICIVFIPMFLLTGVAKYLFIPLAESVVFSVMSSYLLSRTLVPTLAMYLLKEHQAPKRPNFIMAPFVLVHSIFESCFNAFRRFYGSLLDTCLRHPYSFTLLFLTGCGLSCSLIQFVGRDFFPDVDAGQFKLHIRAKTGTRIEETAKLCDDVEAAIRQVIPPNEMGGILDNIGLPYSGINLSYSNSGTVGTGDADILVSLNPGHHPTAGYKERLRKVLPQQFPGVLFAFQPADIVNQILNFGLPAPIDIQFRGAEVAKNLAVAEQVAQKMKEVPGAVDVRVQQVYDEPSFKVAMDRSKAEQLGVTGHDIANSVLVALSGSFQTTPTFWLNPKNGVTYNVVVQAPQYNVSSIQDLQNIPIHPLNGGNDQILANLTQINRSSEPGIIYHYNIQPVVDIYANVQGRDLGGVSDDIKKILLDVTGSDGSATPASPAFSMQMVWSFLGIHGSVSDKPAVAPPPTLLPKTSTVTLRGQVLTMQESFNGLAQGMIGAIILVYLLMVVNFQSWVEPFIIIMALPGALAGICWMLFLSGTNLSVPALMGAIMCIGVATANSILVISFARDKRAHGLDGYQAVLAAGVARLRPVIMTAAAMIIGMIPMALGEGEGGEQNAPLGRAVIGGLVVATFATLFFVPVVYRIIRGGRPAEDQIPPAPEKAKVVVEQADHESEQPEPALT